MFVEHPLSTLGSANDYSSTGEKKKLLRHIVLGLMGGEATLMQAKRNVCTTPLWIFEPRGNRDLHTQKPCDINPGFLDLRQL